MAVNDDGGVRTSGYVGRIDDEVDAAAGVGVHDGFAGLREFYVSPHGHTRLFYASRYGKAYVLKCLKADYLYTPLYRRALAKEFEIGLQLDHPCICRTIGMEDVGDLGQVIVMERVDGCTLESIIKEGSLTRALARRIAAQAAGAVDYMHGKQVVHRDLKPSNIMVTHNGHNVKVVDFSLADSDAFEMLKQPGGTSGYIAPEQLLPGAKADVHIVSAVKEEAVRLANAPYYVGRGTYELFVLQGSELVKRRVELGDSNYKYVEVLSGLKPGDRVVVSDMEAYRAKKKLRVSGLSLPDPETAPDSPQPDSTGITR